MKAPNGVVLAGGRSTRMRCEKAFLFLDQTRRRTLLSSQLQLLERLGLHRVMVSVRRDMSLSVSTRYAVVHDEGEDRGPLGGIEAAARVDPDRSLVVLAVDMPLVDERLLSRLLTETKSAGVGAAPRVGDHWEPLCAVYPPGTLDEIGAARSPSQVLDRLHARGTIQPIRFAESAARRFASWNHPRNLPATVRAVNPRTRQPRDVTPPRLLGPLKSSS